MASDRLDAGKLGQKHERCATDVTGQGEEIFRAVTRETRDKKA